MNKNCPIIVTASGFFVLMLGISCSWYLFPTIIEHQINANVALKEGTQAYGEWKNQSFPLKFKIHFFNVTNPYEVQNGARPILTEMGPYVYDEYREKINVLIDDEEDTIEYTLKKTYFFNQKESGCRTEDDDVVILNAGLVGIALQVDAILPTALDMVSEAIPYLYPNTKDIFLRTKVRDILFDGLTIHCSAPEVDFICSAIKGSLPPTITVHPNGHDFLFSMFGHLNGTDDGPYVMGRGLKNTTRGDIMKWQGEDKLSQWNGKYCNKINGSDSTVFHRMDKPAPKIYTFTQDFCRSMYASFDGEMKYKGMNIYRYVTKEDSINNNIDNECFCPMGEDDNGKEVPNCPSSGLINIMPCVQAPILVSYPHFYLGDKSLLDYPIGLKPNPELHRSYIYFEPKTATPLSGMKRAQMNLKIKRLASFDLLSNVTGGVFPLLWLEEGVDLPDDLVKFMQKSFMQIKILDVLKWLLTGIGMILIIFSFVMILHKERLMCFSKVGVMEINDPKRVQNPNISTISNMQNPSLYPQAESKNIHDNLRRSNNNNNNNRNDNNNNNGNNNEMWQFKL